LKSVSISGFIIANSSGNVSIYLENLDKRYLIFNKSFELNKTIFAQNITVEQSISVNNETINETYIQTVNTTQEVNITIEQPEVFYFNDICVETCNLTDVFNENSYKIIFNLYTNISAKINVISYLWSQNVVEHTEEKTELNFSTGRIKDIKGSSAKTVVVRIKKLGKNELWLFDLEKGKKTKIGFLESAPANFPIGLKDKFVFWLSEDFRILFVFDTSNKQKTQFIVPTYDWEKGERARIDLQNIPWEVIVDRDRFYFYSQDTGEVFSDEDQVFREAFREKNNLDLFLTKDELSELNLEIQGND